METMNKARSLPVFRMADTDFFVDIRLSEFREVAAPWNSISMKDIKETGEEGTEIAFDRNTKNIYGEIIDPDNIPNHITLVVVPPLCELDPVGMARKCDLPDDHFVRLQKIIKDQAKQDKPIHKHKKGRRL